MLWHNLSTKMRKQMDRSCETVRTQLTATVNKTALNMVRNEVKQATLIVYHARNTMIHIWRIEQMALLLEHTNSLTRASMQKSSDQSMAKRSAGMVTWPSKPKTSRPQNSPILSKSVTDSTDHWFTSDLVLLTMPSWLKLITTRLSIACAK